jgi:WD40 repeat protein
MMQTDMGASGTLASASLDGNVALWDINTHQRHHLLKGHRRGVFNLAYHQDFHCLISAAFEHSIYHSLVPALLHFNRYVARYNRCHSMESLLCIKDM